MNFLIFSEAPSNAQTSFAPSSVAEELENMGCSDDSFPGGYETIERPNVGSSTDEKETLTYPMGIAVSVPCSHVRSQAHSSHSEETFAANCLSPVKQARWTFYGMYLAQQQQTVSIVISITGIINYIHQYNRCYQPYSLLPQVLSTLSTYGSAAPNGFSGCCVSALPS